MQPFRVAIAAALAATVAGCQRTAYSTLTCAEPPSRSAAAVRLVAGEAVVSGVVTRADSARPVPWAVVTLAPAGQGPEHGQRVQADGAFHLRAPGPGAYTLSARGVGLGFASVPLRLPPDSGAEVRFAMEVRPVVINEACGARIAVRRPWWQPW